jgi:hypothetical protein
MQPPKTALGQYAIGMGALAAGTLGGAYIGSRVLPVGKRYGAMQGGYIGAIATTAGAAIVGFVDPDWAPTTIITTLTGLTVFLLANLASVAQVNKAFTNLDSVMPGLAASAAAASSGEPVVTPSIQAASTPPVIPSAVQPSIITLGTDSTSQDVTANVGDTIVLTLPVFDGYGWYYVAQADAGILRYVSRSNDTGASSLSDTWTVIGSGSYKIDAQRLAIGSNGDPTTTETPAQEVTFNVTVS